MKHLNSFKVFESSSDYLISIIKDIFITLDDSGIFYEIDDFKNIGLIHIEIYGKNGVRYSSVVNDCIDHLINYLKDLGHLYFVGREIKEEVHISIENNFNQEIEKDFLQIIDGIREISQKANPNSRLFSAPRFEPVHTIRGLNKMSSDSRILFDQNEECGNLFYNYSKIYLFFRKYSLELSEVNEIVRYMVGKHLKLEALVPQSHAF